MLRAVEPLQEQSSINLEVKGPIQYKSRINLGAKKNIHLGVSFNPTAPEEGPLTNKIGQGL